MGWKIFDNLKEGRLGEIETIVTFDRQGSINLAASLFVSGLLIILAWYVITKKL